MSDELARVKRIGKAPDRCPEKLRLVRSLLDAWLGDRGKEVTMNDDDMATLRLAFKESEERATELRAQNAELLAARKAAEFCFAAMRVENSMLLKQNAERLAALQLIATFRDKPSASNDSAHALGAKHALAACAGIAADAIAKAAL